MEACSRGGGGSLDDGDQREDCVAAAAARAVSGAEALHRPTDDSVLVEQTGLRITFFEVYHHRGGALRDLCPDDYVSLVKLTRKSSGRRGRAATWGGFLSRVTRCCRHEGAGIAPSRKARCHVSGRISRHGFLSG